MSGRFSFFQSRSRSRKPSSLRRERSGRRRTDRFEHPRFESLESKRLLVFNPSFDPTTGALTIIGTDQADDNLTLEMLDASGSSIRLYGINLTSSTAVYNGVTSVTVIDVEDVFGRDADELIVIGFGGAPIAATSTNLLYGGVLPISTTNIEDFTLDSGATPGAVSLNGTGPSGVVTVRRAGVVTIGGTAPLRVGDLSIQASQVNIDGDITAAVQGSGAGTTKGSITFDVAGSLDIDSAVSAATTAGGVVTIRSAGDVTQVAPLSGNSLVIANRISGDVLLAGADNAFATIQIVNTAESTAGGRVEYQGVGNLTVGSGGTGIVASTGVTVLSGGVLTLVAAINTGSGDVLLQADNGIVQDGDVSGIVAGTLTAINSGGVGLGSSDIALLSGTNNVDIVAVRNRSANGDVTLVNQTGFSIGTGADAAAIPLPGIVVEGDGAIALTAVAGAILVEQQLTTPSGQISLAATAGLAQAATGTISGRSLSAKNTGTAAVSLDVAANDIDFLTGSNTGIDGSLRFKNADGFAVGQSGIGASETSGSLSLTAMTGSITQVGAITTRSLAINAGSAVLDLATNKVGFLSGVTNSGLQFVEANGFTIDSAGLSAAGQEVSLSVASGSILQDPATSGSIVAGTLRLVSTGGATATSLTNAANDVDSLTIDLAVAGAVTFVDVDDVAIGTLDGSTVGIDAPGGTISVKAGGGVSQTGTITAASLLLDAGGDVDLQVAGNDIASLSALGTANVSYRDFGAAGFDVAGQGILASAGNVLLRAAGSITQSARIEATDLTLENTSLTSGSIALPLSTNLVTGTFRATNAFSGGAISLRNADSLVVGKISSLGAITLTARGSLTQSASPTDAITTTGLLSLVNLLETAGTVDFTNPLNDVSSVSLTNANADATTATVAFTNSSDLSIGGAGIVAAASAATITTSGSLSQSAAIRSRTFTAENASNARGSILLGGANDVDQVDLTNAFANGSITFNDTDGTSIGATGISAAGNAVTITLASGDLVQTTGAIAARTFSASTGSGRLRLAGTANEVERLALAIGSAGGEAFWESSDALSITSIAAAGSDVTLKAGGLVGQTGSVVASDLFVETAAGDVVLSSTANDVDRLSVVAAAATTVTYADADGFEIGDSGIAAPLAATTLSFANVTASSTLSQTSTSGAIDVTSLALRTTAGGAGAAVDLGHADNAVLETLSITIAGSAGAVSFREDGDIDIGLDGITAAGGTLTLEATGTIGQQGAIRTTSLVAVAVDVVLDSAANAVTNFAATASGLVTYRDADALVIGVGGVGLTSVDNVLLTVGGALTQTAAVTIPNASLNVETVATTPSLVTLSLATNDVFEIGIRNLSGGAVTFRDANDVVVGGSSLFGIEAAAAVTLSSSGNISQSEAIRTPGLLSASNDSNAAGTIILDGNNLVGSFTAANSFGETGTAEVVFRTLSDLAIGTGGIAAAGNKVTIEVAGTLTQGANSVVADLLSVKNVSTVAGSITLTAATNEVREFEAQNDFTSGAIAYTDATGFLIGGSGIAAAGNAVTLTVSGNLLQSGGSGSVTAGSLAISNASTTGGAIAFDNVNNDVDTLTIDNKAVGFSSSFSDADGFAIGTLAGSTIGIRTGNGTTSRGNVTLTSAGPITQTGSIFANTLAVTLGGATATTLGAANDVLLLEGDSSASSAAFSFTQGTGPLTIGSGGVNAGTNALTLSFTGAVAQQGSITAGSLDLVHSGAAAAAIDLSDDANDVDMLTASIASAGGSLAFTDADEFAIGRRPLSTIGLSAAGNAVRLVAGGAISQTGSIRSGALAVNAGAGATLDDLTNLVTGAVTASTNGDFTLANGTAISVGAEGVAAVDPTDPAIRYDVTLRATGSITQTGAIRTGVLGVSNVDRQTGVITLLNASNDAQTFWAENLATGAGTVGNVSYRDTNALEIGGSPTVVYGDLAVTVAGDLTQDATFAIFADGLAVTNLDRQSGSITLDNAENDVGIFAASNANVLLTAAGGVTFHDASDLEVGTVGAVVGITTTLGTVSLLSTGSITQSAGITAKVLEAENADLTRGSILLATSANDVDTFGAKNAFTKGSVAFSDVDDLAISATFGIAAIGNAVTLTAGAAITQDPLAAAGIEAESLALDLIGVSGDILVEHDSNDVRLLSATSDAAGGLVAYRGTGSLTIGVAGIGVSSNAGDIRVESIDAAITVAADVLTAGGDVALTAANGISQSGTAFLSGDVLSLTTTAIGNVRLDLNPNSFDLLVADIDAGSLSYTDSDDLSLGDIAVPLSLTLTVSGVLDQVAGSGILATDLVVGNDDATAGSINLTSESNDVVTFAASNAFADGSVAFVDFDDVEILGIAAIGNAVTLTASGGLTQAAARGSAIVAETLVAIHGVSAGGIALDNAFNDVAAFAAASAAAAGGITYVDANDLAIGVVHDGGPLGVESTDGVIALRSVAGGLALDPTALGADLAAGTGGILLEAATAITQGGGSITAQSLEVALTDFGDVTLTKSANTVTTFKATADKIDLTVVGSSTVAYRNAADLDLAASIVNGDLSLTVVGNLTQSAAMTVTGVLTVGNESLSTGSITLDAAGNSIASFTGTNKAVGDPATVGSIALATKGDLLVAAGGVMATETVALGVSGDLTQDAAGGIVARELVATNVSLTRGSITLDAAGNDVDDFGAANAAPLGDIEYVDADDLAIATAGITGDDEATISIIVGGDLLQRTDSPATASGAITGGLLTVENSSGTEGEISLTTAANDVVTFSAINGFAGGAIAYTDGTGLDIDGILGGARVTLAVSGDLAQPATATSGIVAAELVVSVTGATGDVSLLLAGNNVQFFSASSSVAGGTISFMNGSDLTVGVVDGAATLGVTTEDGGISLETTDGAITLAGDVDAGTEVVSLTATTGIIQTDGALVASTLVVENAVSGDVIFDSEGNDIDTLEGLVTVAGSLLQFTDLGSLAIGVGKLSSLGDITLSVAGDLTQVGTVSAENLDVTNRSKTDGDLTLTLANAVATFSGLNQATDKNISFTNASSFFVGPIGVTTTGAATASLTSTAGSIGGTGVIASADVVLAAATGIDVLTQASTLEAGLSGTGDIVVSEADDPLALIDGLEIVDVQTFAGSITISVDSGNLDIAGVLTAATGPTKANAGVLLEAKTGSILGGGLVTTPGTLELRATEAVGETVIVDGVISDRIPLKTNVVGLQAEVGTDLTIEEQSAVVIESLGIIAGRRVTLTTGASATPASGHVTQVGEIVAQELVVDNLSSVASTPAAPNGILLTSPLNNVDFFSATVASAGGDISYEDQDDVTIGLDTVGIETNLGAIDVVAGSILVVDPLVYRAATTTLPVGLSLDATEGELTFLVSSELDAGDRSLRTSLGYALDNIAESALVQPSVLAFASDVTVVTLTTSLPGISKPMVFDGSAGIDGFRVELQGSGDAATTDGLQFIKGSAGSEVRSMAIAGFTGGAGISLQSVGTLVANSYIGLTRDGDILANGTGILVTGRNALSNVIGGDDAADRNVIAGNLAAGVRIETQAADTIIRGNFIGIDAMGEAAANGDGIVLVSALRTTIDGGNVISGNDGHGIHVSGSADTTIAGNSIGVNAAIDDEDVAGTIAIANGGDGIRIEGEASTGSVVGGDDETLRNLVSGNDGHGIRLEGGATGITIAGNWIGLASDGFLALGNGLAGVSLEAAPENVIAAGNVISANGGDGIELLAGSDGTIIEGVIVGTDAEGANAVGNGGSGLTIDASSDVVVGSGSLFSGNEGYGILVLDGSVGNIIGGSYVGLNILGTFDIGNAAGGIRIEGADTIGTLVGGTDPNVISGNGGNGIEIIDATETTLEANYVGLTAAGDEAVANAGHGVLIVDAPTTLVQGANAVSGNKGDGIRVEGAGSTGTVILGSFVGTDAFGLGRIANQGAGIRLTSTSGIVVGGLSELDLNVISGNAGHGIVVGGTEDGEGASNVQISGNRIGVDFDGALAIANALAGIAILGAESLGTVIDNNVISGNLRDGIEVDGGAGEVTIFANRVGTDLAGAANIGNGRDGIRITGGGNNTIGSDAFADGNLVSGNLGSGIAIRDGSTNNEISFNLVGLDAAGAVGMGNGGDGIVVDGSPSNFIVSNVVGGNSASGISVSGSGSEDVEIRGNFVGTNLTASKAVANGFAGIEIDGAVRTLVGGIAPADRNVVSGNAGAGIVVTAAEATEIRQNLVGLTASGLGRLGNAGNGIVIAGSVGTVVSERNRIAFNGNEASGTGHGIVVDAGSIDTVVGSLASATGGNLIYSNLLDGVRIGGDATVGSVVAANFIGTNENRVLGLGNGGSGVSIVGSSGHTIGATLPASTKAPNLGNVVIGNLDGITIIDAGADDIDAGNVVLGNLIRANRRSGVAVAGSSNHTIGGALAESANTIVLNGGDGVLVAVNSAGIVVTGNYIGTDLARTTKLGNTGDGVEINASVSTTVGGQAALANVILGNAVGIRVDDSLTADADTPNVLVGNTVQANRLAGIVVADSGFTLVGQAGLGNIVVGNAGDGIVLAGGAVSTTVEGNRVGVTATGAPLGNLGDGIELAGAQENAVLGNVIRSNQLAGIRVAGSALNAIGGTGVGESNEIAANRASGVVLEASATENVVAGNRVDANGLHGIAIGAASLNTIAANVVIRNVGSGIHLAAAAADNVIGGADAADGNRVGTDGSTNTKLGNRVHGIFLERASGTFVENNAVSFNLQHGVYAYGGQTTNGLLPNEIRTNTVTANRGTGIRLDATNGAVVAGNTVGGLASKGLGNATGIAMVGRSSGNTVVGNTVRGSTAGGIVLTQSAGNLIGGSAAEDANVVIQNTGDGIALDAASSGNTVEGNFIGSPADGSGRLGNTGNGVNLGASTGNAVVANTILDNRLSGVAITNSLAATLSAGNAVTGNTISRNASGIVVTKSSFQTIGGAEDGDGNVVSNNLATGISITGLSSNVVVEGNTITGNVREGILVSASTATTIAGNEVAANRTSGIAFSSTISKSPAEANLVVGNLVDANLGAGVSITSKSQFVTIGSVESPNVITRNRLAGVSITGGATRNTVAGNLIGTDGSGATNQGNLGDGVSISAATANTVGEANEIAHNRGAGVRIASSPAATAALGNLVTGNQITANAAGGVVVATGGIHQVIGNTVSANVGRGIFIDTAKVTGQKAGSIVSANTVVSNTSDGISVSGGGANQIAGNRVGVDESDTPLPNRGHGIRLVNSAANTVGDPAGVAGNVVAHNLGNGIRLEGASVRNMVAANEIFENASHGVAIVGKTATDNVVGLQATAVRPVGAGNRVFANLGAGVFIDAGIRNQVFANSLFDNVDGGILLANRGNGGQTAPELSSAAIVMVSGRERLEVTGTVRGTPRQQLIVEFFANAPGSDPQAAIPLGRARVIAGTNGLATFTLLLDAIPEIGDLVTATVTTASGTIGNTSAISGDVVVE